MKKEVDWILDFLKHVLRKRQPELKEKTSEKGFLEFFGTKEVMQGKQKVDGHYFAGLVAKPKDARFYFFPIYTHAQAFSLSPELKKALKGKSCFHIKSLSEEMEQEISAMIHKGVELYRADGLI